MKVEGQLGMDETVLESPELEAALEDRLAAKEARRPVVLAFKAADDRAKALVKDLVEVGQVVRVGRFRVERQVREARHVEFDAEAGDRVAITADGDD